MKTFKKVNVFWGREEECCAQKNFFDVKINWQIWTRRVSVLVEYGQFVSTGVMQSDGEPPAMFVRESMLGPDAIAAVQQQQAVVRPARSASPFFDLFGGYEKPHRTHHHHHHHHEEQEPEYHRPQHHKPQHHYGGGSAGSFASAGSFSGGHGGGQSQSAANSHSASFGFGPFQASYSASSAHAGSHSGGGGGGWVVSRKKNHEKLNKR